MGYSFKKDEDGNLKLESPLPRVQEKTRYRRFSGRCSGHRFLSTTLGRWISRDPIGERMFLLLLFRNLFGVDMITLEPVSILDINVDMVEILRKRRLWFGRSLMPAYEFMGNSPCRYEIEYMGLGIIEALKELCCSVRQSKQVRKESKVLSKAHKDWLKKLAEKGVDDAGGVVDSIVGIVKEGSEAATELLDAFPDNSNCVGALKDMKDLNCASGLQKGRQCSDDMNWRLLQAGNRAAPLVESALDDFFNKLYCECEAKKNSQGKKP